MGKNRACHDQRSMYAEDAGSAHRRSQDSRLQILIAQLILDNTDHLARQRIELGARSWRFFGLHDERSCNITVNRLNGEKVGQEESGKEEGSATGRLYVVQ
jgi:hypothetical protein